MNLKWYKVNIGLVLLIVLFVLNLFLIYGLLYCNRLSSDTKNNMNKSNYAKTISDIQLKEGLNSIISEVHINAYVSSNASSKASTKMAFSDIDFALGRWDSQRIYKLFDFVLIGSEYKEASEISSVCLATQSSVERIHSIIQVADHWNGPISLAVFIGGTDEFLILQYYITYLRACFHRIRKNVVFHIAAPAKKLPMTDTQKRLTSESFNCQYPERTLRKLLKYRSAETIQWRLKNVYPQNHMRNLARKGCESRYVFLTDVDIIPSKNIVKQLNQFLEHNKCKNQCAFVIPTYEIDVRVRFPSSKKELLILVKKGLARPFHEKVFIYNQYATNFSRWQLAGAQLEKDTYISHNVTNFEFLYEPFYVALDNVPAHDERFVGYGFTRNSQVYEMYIAGYEFYVLSPIFTCHWGLQKKKTRPSWREQQNNVNRKRFESFKKEIFARYGSGRFKKVKSGDCMPSIICPKCTTRLKIAFDFIKLAHASEKNLKAFLTKISSDFEEVTKSTSSSVSSPALEQEEVDEDMMMLFEETTSDDVNSNVCDSSEASKSTSGTNLEPKNKTSIKKSGQDSKIGTASVAKIEPCARQINKVVKQEAVEYILNDVKHSTDEIEADAEAEVVEEEEVVYYEDANFLDESETEESIVQKQQYESKTNDVLINEDEAIAKDEDVSVQQDQINGYIEEYNSMLAEQEASSSKNQNYVKRYSYSDDEHNEILEEDMEHEVQTITPAIAATSAEEEVLHLYEDTEDDIEVEDHMITTIDHGERLGLREELNVETLDNTDECLTEESEAAHPIELKSVNQHEVDRRQQKQTAKSKRSAAPLYSATINARFFCVRCNRDFSTKTNLTRHMATHEGIKPYKCTECNKSFSQNGSLKQHMYTHTGEKPYVCEVCNRGFTQCKSLVFHMRRHTGEKPFPCEHCGTFFRQKDGLKTHILKHHMIRQTHGDTETHICDICNKLLSTKFALQVHMKKHVNNHKLSPNSMSSLSVTDNTLIDLLSEDDLLTDKSFISDELALNIDDVTSSTQILDTMTANTAKVSRAKKFQCRKCFKCFAIKKNLLRHLTTHDVSPAELFQCQICQVAFDTNYALRVHRVREHKETGINLNECEICNITFANVSELSEHNSSMHESSDQKCPDCPELNFKNQKQLLEHLIEHESLSNEVDDERM